MDHELATFAAGCFWGVEARFAALDGVLETSVGYMGGTLREPSYAEVCAGNSGHAEVVQLRFDPAHISYDQLLMTFWQIHDPTTLNQQGADIGSQYRSAIFYHTDEQHEQARQSKQMMESSATFPAPIVTEISAATTFWPAEDHHQQYLAKQGMNPP